MLLKLYCLPGRAIAHLNWLFPSRHMDAIRSARQHDSTLVHFMSSTGIYIFAAFLLSGPSLPSRSEPAEALAGVEEEVGEELIQSDELEQAAYGSQTLPQSILPASMDEPDSSNLEILPPSSTRSEFEPLTPESSSKLTDAIAKALEAGAATRWKDQGQAGYVVVSEPDPTTGCRNYFYTVDNRKRDWQSDTLNACG